MVARGRLPWAGHSAQATLHVQVGAVRWAETQESDPDGTPSPDPRKHRGAAAARLAGEEGGGTATPSPPLRDGAWSGGSGCRPLTPPLPQGPCPCLSLTRLLCDPGHRPPLSGPLFSHPGWIPQAPGP